MWMCSCELRLRLPWRTCLCACVYLRVLKSQALHLKLMLCWKNSPHLSQLALQLSLTRQLCRSQKGFHPMSRFRSTSGVSAWHTTWPTRLPLCLQASRHACTLLCLRSRTCAQSWVQRRGHVSSASRHSSCICDGPRKWSRSWLALASPLMTSSLSFQVCTMRVWVQAVYMCAHFVFVLCARVCLRNVCAFFLLEFIFANWLCTPFGVCMMRRV